MWYSLREHLLEFKSTEGDGVGQWLRSGLQAMVFRTSEKQT